MVSIVDADVKVRAKLAANIVLLGVVGIFAVSGLAIWLVGSDGREEMIRLVFASVLPLLGTWVGTVLAFYFARESLQAATDSTARLLGRLDPQTPAKQVMIPKAQIVAKNLGSGDDPNAVSLVELNTLMKSKDVRRIPIFDASGAVRLIVHESTINSYVVAVPSSADPLVGKTVSDLGGVPRLKEQIEAVGIVGPTATVADARLAMKSVRACNDVFVTRHGRRDDPVDGWLTNTDMASWE